MSDGENPSKGEGKAGAWTEEAKNEFLLRVISQLQEDGKTINWNRISMAGRTTKSLQNMWTKVRKIMGEMEDGGGAMPTTPTKATPSKTATRKSTPRKPRAKKSEAIVKAGDSDDEDVKLALKRGAEEMASSFTAKKFKVERDDMTNGFLGEEI